MTPAEVLAEIMSMDSEHDAGEGGSPPLKRKQLRERATTRVAGEESEATTESAETKANKVVAHQIVWLLLHAGRGAAGVVSCF